MLIEEHLEKNFWGRHYSDSKNSKYSSHSKASEIINEQNQDLGFAAAAEEIQQLLDSLVYGALMGVGLSENCWEFWVGFGLLG